MFCSLPIAIIAVVVYFNARRTEGQGEHAIRTEAPRKWLPDWHVGLVWRLGGLFCCINAIYFIANAFTPIYLASAGRVDLISEALLALNFGQLPASLLLLATAGRLERRAWSYIASGVLSLSSLADLVLMARPPTIVCA